MDASNRTAADQGGEQTLPALSVGPTEHEPLSAGDDDDDDSNSEDDDTLDSPSIPTFKLPALAPQLGTLYLPSPVFAGSFLNLLEPTLAPDPRPSRPRASSTLSRTSVHMCEREPTLAYSRPREMADRRVRRAGREEEVWQACFPDVALELGVEEPSEWGEEEWRELGTFLEQKGYRVDSHAARSGRSIKATRISDSLPLHLKLVPIDESSYELDVLEHLSSSSVRSNASSQRIIATVPLVGLVPLSEDWTAVLTERWEPVLSVSATDFPGFAKDVAAALSFLHTNRIAHLSLSVSSLALSPSLSSPLTATLLVPRPLTFPATAPRYSLTNFSLSLQADPLAKKPTLITGAGPAPEMSDEVAYEPFAVDRYCLGLLLRDVAKSAGVRGVEEVLKGLMVREPRERMKVEVALGRLREMFP